MTPTQRLQRAIDDSLPDPARVELQLPVTTCGAVTTAILLLKVVGPIQDADGAPQLCPEETRIGCRQDTMVAVPRPRACRKTSSTPEIFDVKPYSSAVDTRAPA